jgi:hypothetical protein
MAITGCEFVCKNEECKHKGCGVVLTSPWPLGDIDKIINSQKVAKNPAFKKELENLKSQGRKYACIGLPNSEKIPVVGYRVHMWCQKCPCDWSYDGILKIPPTPEEIKKIQEQLEETPNNPNLTISCHNFELDWAEKKEQNNPIQDAINNANIPENCPTCNTKLKSFGELIDDSGEGVQCTSCHTKLQPNVWFSNEEGEEEKLNPLIKMP